ncbi:hypothetical protein ABZP36_033481 [Zizania latifolia]
MGWRQPHPIHTPTTTTNFASTISPIRRSHTRTSPHHTLSSSSSSSQPASQPPVHHAEARHAMAGVSTSVVGLKPAAAVLQSASPAPKRVQVAPPRQLVPEKGGRRAALLGLAAVFAATAAGQARAGVIDEYLEKSKANQELNDKKRLATSGANFARAYTVEFGSCKFPYNFTGCQDLAKQKRVPFITDDLEIECEGKEKYKCGSNVFWKW